MPFKASEGAVACVKAVYCILSLPVFNLTTTINFLIEKYFIVAVHFEVI